MMNFGDLFGKLQGLQADLAKAQDKLKEIMVTGESGGGMVKVTASCDRKVRKIEIDPEIIDKTDPVLMQDLIIAAVNIALDKAEIQGKEELAHITKGALPNIPGMDLSKFGLPG